MTNQYALGYKAGLDAAVKVCREIGEGTYDADACNECANIIESIPVVESVVGSSILEHTTQKPVLEFEWLDLTDDEMEQAWSEKRDTHNWHQCVRAVIAKFKEKQFPTNSCQNSTQLAEKDCGGAHHAR